MAVRRFKAYKQLPLLQAALAVSQGKSLFIERASCPNHEGCVDSQPATPASRFSTSSGTSRIKIAARVIETASRVRLAFAASCPEADLFRSLPGALIPLGP
jgi:hypothetical protein